MIKKEIPTNLHIMVGYSCSNACVFCMEERDKRYLGVKDFIEHRIYQMMDEYVGVKKVIFTQGEPTLNPELVSYIEYAKQKGFKEISLISNGRNYRDRIFCEKLLLAGVSEFIVSIHGHDEKIHDTLTRRKGSFAETNKGLANLSELKKEYKFKLVISHVVNKLNYRFLESFLAYLKRFEVDSVVLNVVQPMGANMQKYFQALMPRYFEIAALLEDLFLHRKELFFSNKNKGYLSIIDMPLCSSKKLHSHMGFGEVRIVENSKRKVIRQTNVPHKQKQASCGQCKYVKMCEGVYSDYVAEFGWDEFRPLK